MWKITLCLNVLILALFCILCWVAITPANNLLVRYANADQAMLPIFTDIAIQLLSYLAWFPVAWAATTFILGLKMNRLKQDKRNEWLLAHTSLTLCIGLSLFLFYLLSGILPILKIGFTL